MMPPLLEAADGYNFVLTRRREATKGKDMLWRGGELGETSTFSHVLAFAPGIRRSPFLGS